MLNSIIFSLSAVVMLFTLMYFAKRFGNGSNNKVLGGEIHIEGVKFIDGKRKVVCLKFRDNKYLIMTGGNKDFVIDKICG